jgi:hypothetical protein
MKHLIRPKQSRAVRPMRLAASAVAVAAAVAAGIAAGQGDAARTLKAGKASYLQVHKSHNKASYRRKVAEFKHPKFNLGVLTITGTDASDKIALRLEDSEPDILQIDVGDDGSADFSFKRKHIAKIAVNAGGGDDLVRIDEINGALTDSSPTTIEGADGNDTIAGGTGVETLLGGDGNDSIDGNGGDDVASMGDGDDVFVWDPGDGSDTVDGQAGADTMLFNGAGGAEQIDVSANGSRLRFFRVQGNITMDTVGVERVDFNALGGADLVTVNDLTGTDVSSVNIDLANTVGGTTGDGQADRVVVNATNGNDTINVNGDAAAVKVSGLAATVAILHAEAANDRLEINTLAGTDTVGSSALAAGAIQLFVNGALVP